MEWGFWEKNGFWISLVKFTVVNFSTTNGLPVSLVSWLRYVLACKTTLVENSELALSSQ